MSTAAGLALLTTALAVAGCATSGPAAPPAAPPALTAGQGERVEAALGALLSRCRAGGCALPVGPGVEVDTVLVAGGAVEVRFSRDLGDAAVRPAPAAAFTQDVADAVARVLPGAPVRVVTRGVPLAALVPNASRADGDRDASRLFAPPEPSAPLVRPADPAWTPAAGLAGRHVALWPSHGWLYSRQAGEANPDNDSWGWQRARLFTTVEDLLTVQLVTHTLVPMLERAGAVVLLPRERDPQRAEVIVDDGGPGYAETGAWAGAGLGFGLRDAYGEGLDPFALGTARMGTGGAATWTADLPAPGAYAVHVSYAGGAGRTDAARYTVRHAGGESDVLVNQRMGGGTWVYLGTFEFDGPASVALSGDGGTVSADAVRFGGGVGVVARDGQTSGRPRWTEASRYYQQFAGAPPAVYNVTGEPDEDYVDDYRSRGEWVNWLRGAPFGPSFAPDEPGLGVPVDLSLAWHTDAGIDRDGVIGTLLIYDTPGIDSTGVFADGTSRLANRDLADGLQTQIVDDLRATFDATWRRRSLWDRNYSEAARPAVPSALLELLSHQNFRDMRLGLDPRFQAVAARAVYKALGRSLAEQRGRPFVVQPLRPTHLRATFDAGGAVALAWRPQADPLEPTATADAYLVQTRDGERGWTDGTLVRGTETRLPAPPPGVVRSYRVAAVNAGGASAPSVAVAVGVAPGAGRPVLVVDAFDRVAPPAWTVGPDSVGFTDAVGVPDGRSVLTVGAQVAFDPDLAYESDAQPGWGASGAALETTVIAGNTRDTAAPHGRALLAAGRSFVSATDEAVEDGLVPLADYPVVDLALGLERRTPYPDPARAPDFEALPAPLRERLGAYLDGGGALVVSGAHWLSDAAQDPASAAWVRRHLGAEAGGTADADALEAGAGRVPFRTTYGPEGYAVRQPDVVAPAPGATPLARYPNGRGGAVAFGRTVSFGVPLEAVSDPARLAALLGDVLATLED